MVIMAFFVVIELDNSFSKSIYGMPDSETTIKVKSNVMFIKTHKTGSSTLGGLFYLYGIRKKFNFVLFPYTNKLSEVGVEDKGSLIPPRHGQNYNMQIQHAVFNPDFEHNVLPKNRTFYTTVVRSPIGNFKSSFVFFGHEEELRKTYKNPDKYPFDELADMYLDKICKDYKLTDNVKIGDGCLLINSAASDLGWRRLTASMQSDTIQERIDQFIKMLDTEFDLVMITDRMDESLVVLKELMNWEMKDILFLNQKTSAKKPNTDLSTRTERKILDRMSIDSQIFNHFNTKLDTQIDNLGKERIEQSVMKFRSMRQSFEDRCYDKKKGVGKYCVGCVDHFMENVVGWQLSEYGKTENPSCAFLDSEFSNYCRAISDLQLSHDYTDMKFQYQTSPEDVRMRKIIQKMKWG